MLSDPGARTSDPVGSHTAVAAIAEWSTLADAIMVAVQTYDPIPCDDGDIVLQIEALHGMTVQRNVVARARGILEREGKLVRIGSIKRGNHKTLHFRLPDGETRAADPIAAVERPAQHAPACYTELDGWQWCTAHGQMWDDGDDGCNAMGITYNSQDPDDPCQPAPLYLKE